MLFGSSWGGCPYLIYRRANGPLELVCNQTRFPIPYRAMTAYSARKALLGNLIDYAGTFPPAALSLEKAMAEACAFRRRAQHPWLMARIVITIADLKKLSPRAWFDVGADGTPLPLTVIGSPIEKFTELSRTVAFEMRELRRFNERFTESSLRQRAFAYETKLGDDCPLEATGEILLETLNGCLQGDTLGMDVYFEVPLSGAWQMRLSTATRALSEWGEDRRSAMGSPGVKIRTGGKTPPSPEQLSESIAAILAHGLKFKATQGLHHPLTRGSEYGFVNLFAALAFAQGLGLDTFGPGEIRACLMETEASKLKVGDVLEWNGFQLEPEAIEGARRQYGGTFGSCSIAEPDQFLADELF